MWTCGKFVQQEKMEILCDDTIGCTEARNNDDSHRNSKRKCYLDEHYYLKKTGLFIVLLCIN